MLGKSQEVQTLRQLFEAQPGLLCTVEHFQLVGLPMAAHHIIYICLHPAVKGRFHANVQVFLSRYRTERQLECFAESFLYAGAEVCGEIQILHSHRPNARTREGNTLGSTADTVICSEIIQGPAFVGELHTAMYVDSIKKSSI